MLESELGTPNSAVPMADQTTISCLAWHLQNIVTDSNPTCSGLHGYEPGSLTETRKLSRLLQHRQHFFHTTRMTVAVIIAVLGTPHE